MDAVFRFHLHKGYRLQGPAVETPGSPGGDLQMATSRRFMTLGIHTTLMPAAQEALRQMLDVMKREYGVSRAEAYILSSLMVDLTITQAVNTPRWTVRPCYRAICWLTGMA